MNFVERFIASKIVKRIAKEIEMRGWITKTAGIGGLLLGAGMVITALTQGNFDGAKEGATVFLAALAALGIGRKVDKNTEAVEKAKQ